MKMTNQKCDYKGNPEKSWNDLMEEATGLMKKNAGLLSDRYRIYRAVVNVMQHIEKITPIEPRVEQLIDLAKDELLKIVSICIPQEAV
jgi:hypothetical protein